MIRRMAPTWVYSGAFLLTAIAGSVNVVAWIGAEHRGITHVTGAFTDAAARAANHDFGAAGHSLATVLAFLFGAVVSGALIGDSSLKLGRRYGVGLVIEGALLVAAWRVRRDVDIYVADYLAAAACGLQNALATSFSGAVLRTTHMTGIVTDLGILLGHALRGVRPDLWRLSLYLALLAGFSVGGALGAVATLRMGPSALLIPASAALFAGTVYWAWVSTRSEEAP